MKRLNQIGKKHQTDKATFGYLDVYQDFFESLVYRQDLIIAEVGVLGGSSLNTWRDFFPNATIIGIDKVEKGVNERSETVSDDFFKSDENSEFYLCDQSDRNQLEKTKAQIKQKYSKIDIFIDDGSHFQHDMAITFEIMFDVLSSNGIYIFEDICTTENLKKGDLWWGGDNTPKIENCIEQTIIRFIEKKKIENDYIDQLKISKIESDIKNCFFYKALTPPLTQFATSSLAVLLKK
jgi:hypothetical protein